VLLVACGGRALTDSSDASDATDGDAATSGGTSNASEACLGGAPDPGGCGGAAGERPLDAYARLRTACSLNVKVNRRGGPVSIDYCIR